jgi:cyclopropane-fatty-acyl-phospholipid synthase
MNSRIYSGTLQHTRSHAVHHHFTYPLHLYALDLDELTMLEQGSGWFGYNRIRPLALHDRDYLHHGNEPLKEKVNRVLAEYGLPANPVRTVLVTALRQFNYVFNPVSFFFCSDGQNRLSAVIVQVNNTFGETHLYPLQPKADGSFAAVKAFHVSPFFPRTGSYRFTLSPPDGETIDLTLTYLLDDKPALLARFSGKAHPLTSRAMARTLLLHPLRALMTFPRILWQAARLYLQKRLPVFTKPDPCSADTIRQAPPTLLQRVGSRVMTRFFGQLDHGLLTLTDPLGHTHRFGPGSGEPQATLTVHKHAFFSKAMLSADIGFGESYVDGDWDSPDLSAVLTLLSLREEAVDDRRIWPALAGRALNYLAHLRRPNSLHGSRKNIGEHYDLGNDFYRLFLDPTLSYSSAIFADPAMSLEEAQLHKIRTIIDKAAPGPDDHVLEIGCGWGALAMETVRRSGCRVTAITLSEEQFNWVTRRVREEGLDSRIEVRLTDYRQVQGRFDRIISIEMIEAVGHANLPAYFATLERLLAPHGRIVLQAITMPDQKYRAYRFGSDWIRKHIFPGGHLPSLAAMVLAMAGHTRLNVVDLEDIGSHYVETLVQWRRAFVEHREEVRQLGFDERFLRKWEYYLCYCEAGFANQLIRNYHLVLMRMGEAGSGTVGKTEPSL